MGIAFALSARLGDKAHTVPTVDTIFGVLVPILSGMEMILQKIREKEGLFIIAVTYRYTWHRKGV